MLPETKFFKLVNKSFLSEIVGEGVSEYRVSTGSKQGDNVASSLVAIDIKTQSKKILNIVIKVPPYDSPSQYTYAKQFRIFELENQFYKTLVPELEALHRDAKHRRRPPSFNTTPKADPPVEDPQETLDLPLPKYYGGNEEFLALEDVRPAGYRMSDKMKGLNFDEVKLVMDKLGKFHATTYAFLKDRGDQFFEESDNYLFLNMLTNNVHIPAHNNLEKEAFHSVYARACEILTQRNPKLGAQISKLSPKAQEIMTEIYRKTDVQYFPIISHGDIWVNNLIFRYEGEANVATDVIFLDFQQARRENIFWDLLYFMYTSTTPGFRKEFLIPSLMVYYDSFLKTVDALRCVPPIGFSRGWLIDEFYSNIPSAFAYLAFAIPLQLGDFTTLGLTSPRPVDYDQPGTSLLPIEQTVANLVDMVVGLLQDSELALDRFEEVAEELNQMGIFDKF